MPAWPTLRLPSRAGRRTNLGLLLLLLAAALTGVLAYGVGVPGPARWVVAVHGAAGLGLLLLVPWKSVVVRRTRRRPLSGRHPTAALALGGTVVLAVVTGVLHVAGVAGPWPVLGGLGALTVHVAAAVVVLPLLVVHAWGRRQRPRRTDLSRRFLLLTGALGLGAAALWTVGEGAGTPSRTGPARGSTACWPTCSATTTTRTAAST